MCYSGFSSAKRLNSYVKRSANCAISFVCSPISHLVAILRHFNYLAISADFRQVVFLIGKYLTKNTLYGITEDLIRAVETAEDTGWWSAEGVIIAIIATIFALLLVLIFVIIILLYDPVDVSMSIYVEES